MKTKVLNF